MSLIPMDLPGSIERQISNGRDLFNQEISSLTNSMGGMQSIPQTEVYGGNAQSTSTPTPSSPTSVLAYPSNLGSDEMQHYVQFEIFIVNTGATFHEQSEAGQVNFQHMPRMSQPGTDGRGRTLAQTTQSFESTTKYVKLEQMIGLPIPETVVSDHSTHWSKADGDRAAGAISWADSLGGSEASFTDDVKNAAKRMGMGIAGGMAGLMEQVGIDGATTVIKAATRRTKNPRSEFLFDGVGNRSFNFQWKFIPKSEEEFRDLFAIMERLKLYMYPELDTAMSGAFFIFPALFDITFKSGSDENPWLYRSSSCALTNIIFNYTGAGQWVAMEKNSAPFAIEMTLAFTEVEFLHRQRFKDGIVR